MLLATLLLLLFFFFFYGGTVIAKSFRPSNFHTNEKLVATEELAAALRQQIEAQQNLIDAKEETLQEYRRIFTGTNQTF